MKRIDDSSNNISPEKKVKSENENNNNFKLFKSPLAGNFLEEKILGFGAYGVVSSAMDKRNGKLVAIKKNVIKLVDMIKPQNPNDYNDIYLIFEYMQTDLEKILTDEHIKYFMYQLLLGIQYMHSTNIVHRDIKPNNIFLNKNCDLKIGDLGLARICENSSNTNYVVTRWYRAPEIMFTNSEYTKSIDIWSIGCIFAELQGRTPIFQGQHYVDQIERIIAILGTPPFEDLPYSLEEKTFTYLKSLPKRNKIDWTTLFPKANPVALELMDQMLFYNPNKRINAENSLRHPYFSSLFKETDLKYSSELFDWSFDSIPLKKQIIQEAIYKESLSFLDNKPNSEINEKLI